MTERTQHPYALKVTGPAIVLVLIALALWIVPIQPQTEVSDFVSSTTARLETLNDADLAGPTRTLPARFDLDVGLRIQGSRPFDDAWERYPFFGSESFSPRRPESIVDELQGKESLTQKQLSLLLDALLRYRSPNEAMTELERRLADAPKDAELYLFAAGFAQQRLRPQKAVNYQVARFEILAAAIPNERDELEKIKLSKTALSALDRIDQVRTAYLLEGDTDPLLKKLIGLCPQNAALLYNYLDRLIQGKRYDDAYTFLLEHEKDHADKVEDVLSYKARILEGAKRIDEAVALYENHPLLLDDVNALFGDLLSLLARNHRTESWRRALVVRTREALDMPAIARLFRYYGSRGDTRLIEQLLDTAETHAKTSGISEADLEALAALCEKQGGERFANRALGYRWNLYALAPDDPTRQRRAADLANVLEQASAPPPFPVSAALSGAARTEFLDRYPGLAGGVLSLDLNLRATGYRFSQLERAGQRYENMRLALALAKPLIDKGAPEPVALKATRVLASVYGRLGLLEPYAQILERFIARFPDAKNLPDILWQLADHHRQKKDVEAELAVYQRLIRIGNDRDDRSLAQSARKRIVDRLVQEKRFDEVIPFYWAQVDRHKDQETLLAEFIRFCEGQNIFEETVRAYELAAERFDRKNYSDKLAGYLLRNKKRDAFESLTRSLAQALNQADLETYLNNRVTYYGQYNSSDSLFYERMYTTGLSRFPDSRLFLDRLLNFYARFENKSEQARTKRTQLLARYFSTDPALGTDLCRELGAQHKLYDAIARLSSANQINPVEMRFLSEALGFVSRFEAQYDVIQKLLPPYQEPSLIRKAASLERSLGSSFYARDGKLTESAAGRYQQLAARYPTESDLPTLSGETFVEAGKRKSAAQSWERILQIEPGHETPYLDLATLYWDYYMFDHALGVIEQGRAALNNSLLLAKEKSYIFESMDKLDQAIGEYVRILCSDPEWSWEIDNRVSTLENRKSLGDAVPKAFERYLSRPEASPAEVLAYGDYLARHDRRDQKTALFEKNLDRFSDEDFLTTISDFFGGMGQGDLAQKALERLADVTGRGTDVLLRLLAFYESSQKDAEVLGVGRELLDKNGPDSPRHEEILDRVSQAFWDADKKALALDGYEKLAALAQGATRDRRLFTYATRCLKAGRETQGETVLKDLALRYPLRTEYLGALAEHYGRGHQYEKLAALYADAIGSARKADLTDDTRRELIEGHRRNLIRAQVSLGRPSQALDQYIEILNRAAPDDAITDEVFRFAQTHQQGPRLMGYYEKLAEKSHKDFRWQLILGDLLDWSGRPKDAAVKYEKAIQNEPQKLFLYSRLSKALLRAGEPDGALRALERRYALSGAVSDLRRLAEVAFQTGRRDQAIKLLTDLVSDAQTPGWRLFEVALIFESNDAPELARDLLVRAMDRFRADPVKTDLDARQLEAYARMIALRSGYLEACGGLLSLSDWLSQKAAAGSGLVRSRLIRHQSTVASVLQNRLAQSLYDFAPPQDRQAVSDLMLGRMKSEITGAAASGTSGPDDVNRATGFYLGFADRARLPILRTETLATKAQAFETYRNDSKRRHLYRNAVLLFLDDLRLQGDSARVLGALKQNRFADGDSTEYQTRRARFAFFAGDPAEEIGALANLYAQSPTESFGAETTERRRYLTLLLEKDPLAFASLARTTRRPGMYIHFAAHHGKSEIALDALAHHFGSKVPSWHFRRQIQILEYQGDVSQARARYETLLGLPRNIGAQANRPVDRNSELVEGRWYEWALRYGKLLLLQNDPNATAFLPAGIEDKPKKEDAYLALARIYADAGRFDQARQNIELARHLSPDSTSVPEALGDVYLKMGKMSLARSTYESLIASESASLNAYRSYYRLMEKAGVKKDALSRYMNNLKSRFPKLGYYTREDELRFVIEQLDDPEASARFLRSLVQLDPTRLDFYDLIIDNLPVADDEIGWFIEGASRIVLDSTKYSPDAKRDRLHRLYEHALAQKDSAMGQRAIESLRRLDPTQDFDWAHITLAAKLALACDPGETGGAALIALGGQCKDRSCFDSLEQIAADLQRPVVEKKIRYRKLEFALGQNDASLSDRIALAGLHFESGKPEAARSQLEYVAAETPDDPAIIGRVIWAYLEAGFANDALPHAQSGARVAPADSSMTWARALTLACAQQPNEAVELMSSAFTQRKFPRSQMPALFAQAQKALEKAKARKGLLDALAQTTDHGTALLRAYLRLESDQGHAALDALSALAEPLEFPGLTAIYRAQAYRLIGDRAMEIEALDRAIALNKANRKLYADLFLAAQALGQSAKALDRIEFFLPTNRHHLLDATSTSASLSGAKALPGKFGLGGHPADRLLEAVAESLLALDRPAEAKTYLQALTDRTKNRLLAAAVKERIAKLTERIKALHSSQRPWPVITNET